MLLKHESGRFGPWLATGRVQCNRARGIGGACSAWATLTNLFLTGASKCAEPAKGGSQGFGGAKSTIGGVTIVPTCFQHVRACSACWIVRYGHTRALQEKFDPQDALRTRTSRCGICRFAFQFHAPARTDTAGHGGW
jgi:hypothetical protein